jgi:hypothetical protein
MAAVKNSKKEQSMTGLIFTAAIFAAPKFQSTQN